MTETIFKIAITESAAAEIRNIIQEENIPDTRFLRLGVKGGGCSGLSYILEFEEKSAFDDLMELSGIKVIIDKRHQLYLDGIELDYQYGLNNRGFIFNNPNAKNSCGCGTSFST
ncbi:MAG: iron-sulfur cluster assembly accessory protein [Bacteroidia bacterium]|nr:iron-sulfur cluster assembly accessory protein [Bacteroidia bacterium]